MSADKYWSHETVKLWEDNSSNNDDDDDEGY